MELLILLGSLAVVYLLAWGLAWLLTRIAPAPDWIRPALPWLLAGTLPWVLALLFELTLQAAAYFRP